MRSPTTDLIIRANHGDAAAMSAVYAQLYPDIKRVAKARLAHVGGVAGLNATALVHEGFMRMAERENMNGNTRIQFFTYVGKVLRSIVLDFIRARDAEKRGDGVTPLTISHAEMVPNDELEISNFVALEQAMEQLKAIDEGMYHTAELHFFCGMTVVETAKERGISARTVNREILKARALLSQWLEAPMNT